MHLHDKQISKFTYPKPLHSTNVMDTGWGEIENKALTSRGFIKDIHKTGGE